MIGKYVHLKQSFNKKIIKSSFHSLVVTFSIGMNFIPRAKKPYMTLNVVTDRTFLKESLTIFDTSEIL